MSLALNLERGKKLPVSVNTLGCIGVPSPVFAGFVGTQAQQPGCGAGMQQVAAGQHRMDRRWCRPASQSPVENVTRASISIAVF